MKTFSEKFEQNANLQLRKVTRAIDLYVKNVYIKSRLVRYVNSQNGFGMMQPLKPILIPKIGTLSFNLMVLRKRFIST